jgi:hypothetical protein
MNRRRLLTRTAAVGPVLGAAACGLGGPSGPPAGLSERAVTLRYLT